MAKAKAEVVEKAAEVAVEDAAVKPVKGVAKLEE